MSSPWYTTAFGAHYPLLYAHRDEDEARRCLELLPRLVPLDSARPVLDLGCGDGRHLGLLVEQGYRVVGLDLSPHLLAAASARFSDGSAVLIRGDMRFLPLADRSLGTVLSLFTAFGYFGVLADNSAVIDEIQRVLVAGGHWYLDYVDCDSVRRELSLEDAASRQREIGPLAVTETRRLAEQGRLVEKTVTLNPRPGAEVPAAKLGVPTTGVSYTERVALFDHSEIMDFTLGKGLRLVAEAGSYTGLPLGQGKRWIMVFRNDGIPAARETEHGV